MRAEESPWGEPGAWRPPRADHVVLDAIEGTVALLAYEALGGGRMACDRALVAADAPPSGPDAGEDLRYLQLMAAQAGIAFAAPGSGSSGSLHRRAMAAPGRSVCGSGASIAGAGAYGMLAWSVGALECAAALAGHPLPLPRPPVIGVRLEGMLAPVAAGLDVLAAVRDRLGPRILGAILECHGPGVAALEMDDRLAFAAHAPAFGARAAVFPADERTRLTMRAQGREEDWRRFEGGSRGFDDGFTLDLSEAAPRALAAADRVVIGPDAEDDVIRRVRAGLAASGQPLVRPVEWRPGGRLQRDLLREDGTLAALEALGVAVGVDAHAVPRGEAAWLGWDAAAPNRSLSPAAAVALALGLPDAAAAAPLMQGARLERGAPVPEGVFLSLTAADAPVERGSRHRVPAPTRGHGARTRGVAVARAASPGGTPVLPRGPRIDAVRAEGGALASWFLRDYDPGAAARALAHGGGFMLAGSAWTGGDADARPARALAALGVHVVLADAVGDEPARQLALHGVLPLTFEHAALGAAIEVGDELEVTSRGEALEAGARVGVRNLTRGVTVGARVGLAAPWVAIARQGGWLATCIAARERDPGGRIQ